MYYRPEKNTGIHLGYIFSNILVYFIGQDKKVILGGSNTDCVAPYESSRKVLYSKIYNELFFIPQILRRNQLE
jgi:hypothetical protein